MKLIILCLIFSFNLLAQDHQQIPPKGSGSEPSTTNNPFEKAKKKVAFYKIHRELTKIIFEMNKRVPGCSTTKIPAQSREMGNLIDTYIHLNSIVNSANEITSTDGTCTKEDQLKRPTPEEVKKFMVCLFKKDQDDRLGDRLKDTIDNEYFIDYMVENKYGTTCDDTQATDIKNFFIKQLP